MQLAVPASYQQLLPVTGPDVQWNAGSTEFQCHLLASTLNSQLFNLKLHVLLTLTILARGRRLPVASVAPPRARADGASRRTHRTSPRHQCSTACTEYNSKQHETRSLSPLRLTASARRTPQPRRQCGGALARAPPPAHRRPPLRPEEERIPPGPPRCAARPQLRASLAAAAFRDSRPGLGDGDRHR